MRILFATKIIVFAGLALGMAAASGQTFDDGQGAYRTGQYRNLLAEDGHPPAEVHKRIEAVYQQLFHGDPQTEAVAFAAGRNGNGPLMYLTDWANHDVRTEGMSYGMMINVELGKKAEFDALWNWAKSYMFISDPKHPSYGYFSWSCKTTGEANEETPAPDGEEYFAMALLFAAHRWPGGTGIYDYQREALTLLRAMRHRAVIEGQTKFGHRAVGPEVDEEHAQILFIPGRMPRPFTDPSYHLPAFYELWARWGPEEDREFWLRAAAESRRFFVRAANARTGLTPTYANFDGSPMKNGFVQSDEFGYDAWRTASNWAVDWSWWRKDGAEQQLSDRIQAFFAGQGIDRYGPVYSLEGRDLGATPGLTHEDHPAGLVGTNAVAGLAATDAQRARRFVHALWETQTPRGQGRYYDGMLYLMSLMHAGGEFRIWK